MLHFLFLISNHLLCVHVLSNLKSLSELHEIKSIQTELNTTNIKFNAKHLNTTMFN